MADQWYFAWGQHKFGPFTTLEMKELAASGRLQPADTVWKEGVETGVLASRVKNLFPNRNPPSTPVPLPPENAAQPEAPLPAPDETLPIPEPRLSDADLMLAPPQESPAEEQDSEINAEAPTPNSEKKASGPHRPQEKERKGVVMGATGAIIISQDGRTVQFRKKCRKCGHEDNTRSTLPIRNGTSRAIFFCPKCKKPSNVEIRGKL
jgi:hypothetical protein